MIRMSEQKDMSGDKTLSGGGFNINPVDIIMYLLSKWYWFVLSVSLFGGYAWYQYAKLPFIYSRSATVMIKDAYSNNIGRGLDRFNTYSYTNVSNEILQFQSHKLMRDVVNRLHANVCYLIMDDLREEELYTQAPVKVSFPEEEDHLDFSLTVRILNRKQVRLSDFSTDATSITLTANLGDTIQSPVGKIVVSPTLYYTDKWFNTPITIRRQSTDTMASLFRSNLNISQAENDASILYLSLRDYSTARAEDVLNMLITVYNEETIKDKNQIAINTSSFINERLVIIEKELGGVENELQSYKQNNDIIDIGSAASMSMSDKRQYSSTTQELELQARMARYIKSYLVDPSKETELIPSNTGIADINIETQIAAYNANKLKRDKLIEGSSDKNPIVQELNKNLIAMRQNIIRAIDNMIVSIDVKLNVSIVRKNEKDYDEIIRLAQHLDIPAEVNSYMFPLSRPECGSLRNILTERLDADEAARIEMQYMEYKKGNDMARYMHDLKYTLAHVEGTRACSLECRAAKSSCWINWQGILTPCVMLDQPAVDLKKIPMTTAWQQLLEEAKELVSHTECEGCHLRPVCNVCYAAAHCEKTITGSMDYLCQMAKAKERIITNYPPVIH